MTRCAQIRSGRRCVLPDGHSSLHVYRPLATIGRRARRQRRAWEECCEAVRVRSMGLCEVERLLAPVDRSRLLDLGTFPYEECPPRPHTGHETHHVVAGDRAAGIHDPDRCIRVCWFAHRWITDHPFDARVHGLVRSSWSAER